jgi:ribosomal protein L7/L12
MLAFEYRSLEEILPDEVKKFIASEVVVGDATLPSRYPKLSELGAWQVGFRSHGITGESLVSKASGAWQPGWYVIALNGFDDPFLVDIDEGSPGFPVYYAAHGAGRWDAIAVAPSLQRFAQLLSALRDLADDDARAVLFIETETGAENSLWDEVYKSFRSREALGKESGQIEAKYDAEDLQRGTLFVTDVGPQKTKVVQILRGVLDLSLREALALATGSDIVIGTGPMIQFRRIHNQLVALGASVEFRPNAAPTA